MTMKINDQVSDQKALVGTFARWLGVLLASVSVASGVTVNDFTARVYTNAQKLKLPYRLFIPANYDAATPYPLVYYLHSALEFGSDNKLQLTSEPGALVFAAETNQAKYPCFMLAPQCPSGAGYWTDGAHPGQLLDLLALIEGEFTIDPDRVYLAGMSMGASMTWQFIAKYPDKFAAAIPLSGGAVSPLSLLTNTIRTAVWNFHAVDDGAVGVSNSRGMIDALRKYGGNPIYTEYATGGHSSGMWTPALRTPGLVDWLMAQRRGVRSTARPFVAITRPPAPSGLVWPQAQIDLEGSISDTNLLVTQVTWKNTRNNATGTAIGSNDWSAAGIPLLPGANLITVIAKGTSWSAALRGNTTFNDTLLVTHNSLRIAASAAGGALVLRWNGGTPPYRLQSATEPGAASWTEVLTTDALEAVLPANGPAAFFRVSGR